MDIIFLIEVLQIITASSILFVWVVRYDNIISEFQQYQLPVWLRDMVGILKLSFAIMLLVGIFNDNLKLLGSSGLIILMLAALLTHVKVKNPFYKALPSLTLLTFSTIILLSNYLI
tara:strand:+ start:668 stop:1015 length:348 start_codon:yes stop_codon:yes gene_type:complete